MINSIKLATFLFNCSFLFRQAEARAEFAERSVQKLQKEVDRLEGKFPKNDLFLITLKSIYQ